MPRGMVNNSKAPNLAMRKLETMLEQQHMTYADLARQLRIHPATVTYWRQGRTPRRARMTQIAEWSHGNILPVDWMSVP